MNTQPDISIGVHTTYGFTARLRPGLAPETLENTGFEPLPGQSLHAFTGSRAERFDTTRLAQAVAVLDEARLSVATPPGILPRVTPKPRREPDVVLGRHPRLGIIATVTNGLPRAEAILLDHGFQYRASVDLFAFPTDTPDRTAVAMSAVALRHLRAEGHAVAAAPDITLRRSPSPVPGMTSSTHSPAADRPQPAVRGATR
ncbi:hypothetical protein [Streptomyces cellulosae]|mgnify:CR=1 FL=1|uniref:hypothetical protein n=1 Tax=Streptomyces sp. P9-2 TaxID=3423201 RepID=UPI00167AB97B|nr:hypothetical protein GCM10018771_39570 [Streptomyces cellulosae]